MNEARQERSRFGDLLLEMRLVEEGALAAALAEQRMTGRRLARILADRRILDEERLAKAVGAKLGLETVTLDRVRIHPRVLARLPAEVASRHAMLPYAIKRTPHTEVLYLVMSDPLDAGALKEAQRRSGCQIRVMLAGATALDQAIENHYGRLERAGVPVEPDDGGPRSGSEPLGPTDGVPRSGPDQRPLGPADGVPRSGSEQMPLGPDGGPRSGSEPRPLGPADRSGSEPPRGGVEPLLPVDGEQGAKTQTNGTERAPSQPRERPEVRSNPQSRSENRTQLPAKNSESTDPRGPGANEARPTDLVQGPQRPDNMGWEVTLLDSEPSQPKPESQAESQMPKQGSEPTGLSGVHGGRRAEEASKLPPFAPPSAHALAVEEPDDGFEEPTLGGDWSAAYDPETGFGALAYEPGNQDLEETEDVTRPGLLEIVAGREPEPAAPLTVLAVEIPVELRDEPHPFGAPTLSDLPAGLGETGIIPDVDLDHEPFDPPPPEPLPTDPQARRGLICDDIPKSPEEVLARSGQSPEGPSDDIAEIEEVHLDPLHKLPSEAEDGPPSGASPPPAPSAEVRAALAEAAGTRPPKLPPPDDSELTQVAGSTGESAEQLVQALEAGASLTSSARARLVLALGRALLAQGILPREALLEELER